MQTTKYSFNTLDQLGIEGIIFDYGGTLDTNGHHWGKVIWHAYQNNNIPISEADFRAAYVHVERALATNKIIMPDFLFCNVLNTKLKMQLAYLRDNKVLDFPQLEIDVMHHLIYTELCSNLEKVIRHSTFVLEQLHKRYPMVLVSNFYGNIQTVLAEYNMAHFFGNVVESAVVAVRKPDPKIFALGVEALKMPAQKVLVVGDSIDKDIVPAHSLGCITAWFKGEQWEEKAQDESVAHLIISDLDELLS